jgi:hypothetical protein
MHSAIFTSCLDGPTRTPAEAGSLVAFSSPLSLDLVDVSDLSSVYSCLADGPACYPSVSLAKWPI